MRPIRLELEGFTSFRERAKVDFTDVELFALVGATGAGKSSVIDAMVFALYGTVPRYGDARLVGSVINQRSARALVDFEFAVGDATYRVVREVQRVKGGGGTTREARLERLDRTDALFDGDAKQLTVEIERLLGLTREQFTKCVVLPQGDFQRFLHDKPNVRQDLLVQLLGVEIYGRIGERARQRQKVALARVESFDEQLADLDRALADAPARRERLAQLVELEGVVGEVVPRLAEAADAEAATRVDVARLDEQLALLDGVRAPDELDDVAEAVAELDEELAALQAAEAERADELATAERSRAELPERAAIDAAIERLDRRLGLGERIEKGERLVDDARQAAVGAAKAHEVAAESLTAADRQLEHLRTEHRVAHLASGLEVGDDCPVCHRPLTEVPAHDVADVENATLDREVARTEAERTRSTLDEANRQLESYTTLLISLREQLDEVASDDGGAPREELVARLDAIVQADEALERARTARRTAEERRKKSESRRKKIAKLEKSAWGEFDDLRDKVAVLAPPSAERDDVGRAWQSLCDWAELRRRELAEERDSVQAALASLASTRTELLASLRASFADAGLDVVDEGHREVVVAARARVESELDHLAQLEVQAGTRREARAEAAATEQVAGAVGNLLKANAFEKWLLDEAMRALVDGGSVKLEELSRGQYSLAVDAKSNGFLVVDHHNADEQRSARTLSGGETFLASLALALALAEQVADLAADGAPRLESIFLDEGFGTLDPDTLEVVVAAIEELQAGGLMVGLVSHVVELAERVPVRFVISKGPNGSSVERVDQ